MSFDWIRGKNPTSEGIFVWCFTHDKNEAYLGSNCIPSVATTEGQWSFWTWDGVRRTSTDAIWVGDDDPEDAWDWDPRDEHVLRVWDVHHGLPRTGTSRADAKAFVKKWLEDHDGLDYQGCENWISCRYFASAKWFMRYAEEHGFFCILRGCGRIKEKDEDGNLLAMFGGGVFCSLVSWEDMQKYAGKCGAYSVGRKFQLSKDSDVMSFLDLLETWGVHWDYSSYDKVVTIK